MSLNYNPDFPPEAEEQYQLYCGRDTSKIPTSRSVTHNNARIIELFHSSIWELVIPRKKSWAVQDALTRLQI